jgi:cell division protein FtsB
MAQRAYRSSGPRRPPGRLQLQQVERAADRLLRLSAARVARWHPRRIVGATLFTRTALWTTAAICAALLVATLSEVWVTYRLEQQVSQAKAENAWLRRDAATTARQVAWAQAPQTIEDEARARGYVRPGDQPVVIATDQSAQPAAPAPTAAKSSPVDGGGFTGHWPDWWQLFFGG